MFIRKTDKIIWCLLNDGSTEITYCQTTMKWTYRYRVFTCPKSHHRNWKEIFYFVGSRASLRFGRTATDSRSVPTTDWMTEIYDIMHNPPDSGLPVVERRNRISAIRDKMPMWFLEQFDPNIDRRY